MRIATPSCKASYLIQYNNINIQLAIPINCCIYNYNVYTYPHD